MAGKKKRVPNVQHFVVVERLVHHGLLGKLRVQFLNIGDKGDTSRRQDLDCGGAGKGGATPISLCAHPRTGGCERSRSRPRQRGAKLTPLNLAKLAKVLFDNLGCVPRLLDPTDVQRPVLPAERTDSAHVVAVLRVLLAAKDVERGVGQDVRARRESVQVGAFLAASGRSLCVRALVRQSRTSRSGDLNAPVRAAAASKVQADVLVAAAVCARVAGVLFDVDARLGFLLDAHAVVLVASGLLGTKDSGSSQCQAEVEGGKPEEARTCPLVVPHVVGLAGLLRLFAFDLTMFDL